MTHSFMRPQGVQQPQVVIGWTTSSAVNLNLTQTVPGDLFADTKLGLLRQAMNYNNSVKLHSIEI